VRLSDGALDGNRDAHEPEHEIGREPSSLGDTGAHFGTRAETAVLLSFV